METCKTSKTLAWELDTVLGPEAPPWGLRFFGLGGNMKTSENVSMGARFCPEVGKHSYAPLWELRIYGIGWNMINIKNISMGAPFGHTRGTRGENG